MRILRVIILILTMLVTTTVTGPAASAATGGVSEQPSEPRSTTLSLAPTKWKRISFKMGPSIKYWKKVAQCETGSNWKNGGNFSGGLGIAQSTWEGYGGLDFAKHPYNATVLEQVVIANRIAIFGYQTKNEFMTVQDRTNNTPFFRSSVGFNGWGCIKHNRYLKPTGSNTYSVSLPTDKTRYCPQFEDIFKKYGLPYKVFSYIAWRESRCNPDAMNATWENGKITWTLNSDGSYDSGLLQINSSWFKTLKDVSGHDSHDLLDPGVNAMFASWILHFSTGRLKNWNVRAASL